MLTCASHAAATHAKAADQQRKPVTLAAIGTTTIARRRKLRR